MHNLHVVSEYGRFDYAKFLVQCEFDVQATYHEAWLACMRDLRIQLGLAGDEKITLVRRDSQKLGTWAFEVWGEAASLVAYLDWGLWSESLERVDIRHVIDVTPEGLDELYRYMMERGSGGRNIQQFNTRARTKKGGRSTGGIGLAIGSHKSEFRLTVYKRTGEVGAIEAQVGGKRLVDSINTVDWMRDAGDEKSIQNPWGDLRTNVSGRVNVDIEKVTGMRFAELRAIIRGDETHDVAMERVRERIVSMTKNMSAEQKAAIVGMIQQSLL